MKNRIRELRINAGLTQEQLGEKLGKAKSAISKLENGKVDLTLNLMVQLAKIFECHTRDLIADDLSPHDRAEVAVIEKFRCMAEPERRIIYKIMDIEPERPKK